MTVEIDCGMLLGCPLEDFKVQEPLAPWVEACLLSSGGRKELCEEELPEAFGLATYSICYDAGDEDRYVGFEIEDVVFSVEGELQRFTEELEEKITRFEELTGITPQLMGLSNVF